MSYTFTVADTEYTVPLFRDLPLGAIRKARRIEDEMDKAFTILEEAVGVDSDALKAIDSLTVSEFGEWMKGWTQGASLGEASSSSN